MPAVTVRTTPIPGLWVLSLTEWQDHRGRMLKHYQESVFRGLGLPVHYPEEFVSVSRKGVLRGLHFQVPPAQQYKLVVCLTGAVQDAAVDLRKGSPAYGRHVLFELKESEPQMLCLPPGIAHGFAAREDDSVMLYRVTTEHMPDLDRGIRWDSAGIPWDLGRELPVLSERDRAWPSFRDFDSPFLYEPGGIPCG